MKNWIKNIFKPEPLVITFPFSSLGCAVSQFLTLKKKFYSNLLAISSSNFKNNFYNYFDGRMRIFVTENILIYAHSNRNAEYIVSEGNNLIDYNWFIHKNAKNYQVMYGHVCKGAFIFRRSDWKLIFPNWISYNDDVYQYLGTSKAKKINKQLHKNIYSSIKTRSDVYIVKNEISITYNDLIKKLYDSYDPSMGDAITMLNLVNSRDSLEYVKS